MPIGRERLTRRSFGAGIAALAAALSSPGIRSAMASPLIVVDQLAPLFDAAVAIELRGFPPRQPITITAIQTYPNMSSWQGRATFLSDDDSCVYLARQAPISGTYDGVSAMGLIWSAELLPGQTKMPPPGSIMQPKLVQLEATSPDGIRAELMLERHVAGPGVARHPIRTEGIVGTLFLPANSGPHPAVIVLNGGDGGIDEYRGAIVASHGYAALNLGYFGMDGLPRGLVNIPLEYFGNAIRWMRTQAWLGDRFLDGVSWWRTRVVAWRHIHRDQRCHRMGAKWSSILGARSRRAWRHETALHLDVPGKTAAVSPGEQHQHGNTPTRRGRTGASADLLDMGGTAKADAEAGFDAWRSVLEFLEASVKDRR
jgi:hypothetical protein